MIKSANFGLLILMFLVLVNCENEENFDLSNIEQRIGVNFTSDKQRVFKGTSVQFNNETIGGQSFVWTFEGGDPSSSTEANPIVVYAEEGKFKVTLEATNGELKQDLCKEAFITVFSEAGWENFVYPQINFRNTTINGNGALYDKLIPNEQDFIKGACLDVCRWLYKCAEEIDVLEEITYTIEDNGTISAKGGQPPHISIFFSSSYLKQKKDEGLSDSELVEEIKGVLIHELTHGYQFSPQGAGDYQQGTDFFGFLEGMADFVRYVEGFYSTSARKQGGHWNDGYTTSGFFIDWLHSKDEDFLYKLNQSAKSINPWSWEKATQTILHKSVKDLWEEYQKDIASGKIKEIDAYLKKLREGKRPEKPVELMDLTDNNCVVTYNVAAPYGEGRPFLSPDNESCFKLIDNNPTSKFLCFTNEMWVEFESHNTSVVTKYTLTSGNDAPERDPKEWRLLGSLNGKDWDVLDERKDEVFEGDNDGRMLKREFTFDNSKEYKSYKFEFKNHEGDIFQLSEVELWGIIAKKSSVVDITKQEVVFTSGHEDVSGGWGLPEFCYDGDCGIPCFSASNETWLCFENTSKYKVVEYAITAPSDFNGQLYDPSSCILYGSDDGVNWEELNRQENMVFEYRKERKVFSFENSHFYKMHKIAIATEKVADGFLMVGEIELYGKQK